MMNRELKTFISKILIAAFFLIVLGSIVFTWIIPAHYLPVLPWMLGFFTLVALLTHGYQLHLARKDIGKFTRSSMIISMLRLMLYSVFAIVWLANNQEKIAVFVVSLITVYAVYTVVEVTDFARVMRRR